MLHKKLALTLTSTKTMKHFKSNRITSIIKSKRTRNYHTSFFQMNDPKIQESQFLSAFMDFKETEALGLLNDSFQEGNRLDWDQSSLLIGLKLLDKHEKYDVVINVVEGNGIRLTEDAEFQLLYLKALLKSEKVDKIVEYMDNRELVAVSDDSVVNAEFIVMFLNNGLIDYALKLFENMKKEHSDIPESVYENLIKLHFKRDELDKVIAAYTEMRSKNKVVKDERFYSVVIISYMKLGSESEAMNVIEEMKSIGVEVTIHTYNMVIDSYLSLGLTRKAQNLFNELDKHGVTADAGTWNAIIRGLYDQNQIEESQQALEQMQKNGIEKDFYTYCILIHQNLLNKKTHEADLLFAEMKEKSLAAPQVYNILVSFNFSSGNNEKAMEYFNEMRREGLEIDDTTYSALINGYMSQGNIPKALEYYEEMRQKNLFPIPELLPFIEQAYTAMGRYELAEKVSKDMRLLGVKPPNY
eukprot:TRINITY_DN7929_c0_g1_i1.p1 TRINITY_DN7929_c0_g1~~TRINITY_DN7929_c0_g1_i1.p1  ORF type:complete len:469 (+),score=120.86 TRINITY_DN7929_c0_g1_i1:40-1446(+)